MEQIYRNVYKNISKIIFYMQTGILISDFQAGTVYKKISSIFLVLQ